MHVRPNRGISHGWDKLRAIELVRLLSPGFSKVALDQKARRLLEEVPAAIGSGSEPGKCQLGPTRHSSACESSEDRAANSRNVGRGNCFSCTAMGTAMAAKTKRARILQSRVPLLRRRHKSWRTWEMRHNPCRRTARCTLKTAPRSCANLG
eukprot:365636-Chlamydomonas_euryale.AAC.8